VEEPAGIGTSVCPHCGEPLRQGRVGAALRESRVARIVATSVVFSLAAMLFFLPAYSRLKLSALRGEARTQLDDLRRAEMAYHGEWGNYLDAEATPEDVPGDGSAPFQGPGLTAFQQLGWTPARVRCRYQVVHVPGGPAMADDNFFATAECDLDGDGEHARYLASAAEKATRVTPPDVH